MSLKATLDVINGMERDGIIGKYAIAGAVAAIYYVEVASTDDLDILVSFDDSSVARSSGLVTIGPILAYLRERGFVEFRHEGIVIHGWPVQFLPVANGLDKEALDNADIETVQLKEGAVRTRVMKPQHIVATALRVGRPKDRLRILQFLEERAVDIQSMCEVLERHGLLGGWASFCNAVGIENTCLSSDANAQR